MELEELKAELIEGIYHKNMIEIETKFSIGKQLRECPELVSHVSKEDHYYVEFARYPSIDEALEDLGLTTKLVSWAKIKRRLNENQVYKNNSRTN